MSRFECALEQQCRRCRAFGYPCCRENAAVGENYLLIAEQVIKKVSIIGIVVDDRDLLHIRRPDDGTDISELRLYGSVRSTSGYLGATPTLSHNRVTLTRHGRQTLRIQNRDLSPADLDEARPLEKACRNRDARAPRCEQPCDEVVRQE